MTALLPLLGGWRLPRRTAITLQIALCAVAIAVLTVSAPQHGGDTKAGLFFAPILAVVATGALLIGFKLARRSARPHPERD